MEKNGEPWRFGTPNASAVPKQWMLLSAKYKVGRAILSTDLAVPSNIFTEGV
jgi:hypothetical protein